MKTFAVFLAALLLALSCLLVTTAFAQESTNASVSTTSTGVSSSATFNRDAYTTVPVNIGFVSPLSVGNIVQAATGKRIIANVSLHMLGNVGNAVEGLEWSGIFNVQSDYLQGVQGAGIINIIGNDAAWIQGAGIANIVSGRFEGAQGAGVFNIASKGLRGVQGAGVFNVAGPVEGIQGAGVINVAETMTGVQGAGVVNIAQNVRGIQGAGVSNHAANVDGLQISGILNTAKHVTGAQISLINTADNNEGVMIGLFNFSSAHGIHVDFWTDETRFIRFGLRTGNKNFYNLLTAGLQPFNGITLWSLGYGIGTQIFVGPQDYIDISAHGEAVLQGQAIGLGGISRLRFFYGHEFAKNFAVFLGPTINWAWSANSSNNFAELLPAAWLIPTPYYTSGYALAWIGVSGGFRF